MAAAYPVAPAGLEAAIVETQRIYKDNFFPEMKVRWDAYPNNIGHRIWPGCFRCHDGEHKSAEGKIVERDCKSCHTIIAQGAGTAVDQISSAGVEFIHPYGADEDAARDMLCAECHNGKPSME
jgi:hypothetical protein